MFNLERDPGETTNLSAVESEAQAELSALLTAWAEEVEAQIPAVNPDYVKWPERVRSGHFGVDEA